MPEDWKKLKHSLMDMNYTPQHIESIRQCYFHHHSMRRRKQVEVLAKTQKSHDIVVAGEDEHDENKAKNWKKIIDTFNNSSEAKTEYDTQCGDIKDIENMKFTYLNSNKWTLLHQCFHYQDVIETLTFIRQNKVCKTQDEIEAVEALEDIAKNCGVTYKELADNGELLPLLKLVNPTIINIYEQDKTTKQIRQYQKDFGMNGTALLKDTQYETVMDAFSFFALKTEQKRIKEKLKHMPLQEAQLFRKPGEEENHSLYKWINNLQCRLRKEELANQYARDAVSYSSQLLKEGVYHWEMIGNDWQEVQKMFNSSTDTWIRKVARYCNNDLQRKYWWTDAETMMDTMSSTSEDDEFDLQENVQSAIAIDLMPFVKCYNFNFLLQLLNWAQSDESGKEVDEIKKIVNMKKPDIIAKMYELEVYNIQIHADDNLEEKARSHKRFIMELFNGKENQSFWQFLEKLGIKNFGDISIEFRGIYHPRTPEWEDLNCEVYSGYQQILEKLRTKLLKPSNFVLKQHNYSNMSNDEKKKMKKDWELRVDEAHKQLKQLMPGAWYDPDTVKRITRENKFSQEVVRHHIFHPTNQLLHNFLQEVAQDEDDSQTMIQYRQEAEVFHILQTQINAMPFGLLEKDPRENYNPPWKPDPSQRCLLQNEDLLAVLTEEERQEHTDTSKMESDARIDYSIKMGKILRPRYLETWEKHMTVEDVEIAERAYKYTICNNFLNSLNYTLEQRNVLIPGFWALSKEQKAEINKDIISIAKLINDEMRSFADSWALATRSKYLRKKYGKYLLKSQVVQNIQSLADIVDLPHQVTKLEDIEPYKTKGKKERRRKRKTMKKKHSSQKTTTGTKIITSPHRPGEKIIVPDTMPATLARRRLLNKIVHQIDLEHQWLLETKSTTANEKTANCVSLKNAMNVNIDSMLDDKNILWLSVDPSVNTSVLTTAVPKSALHLYVQAEDAMLQLIDLGDPSILSDTIQMKTGAMYKSGNEKRQILETLVDDRRRQKTALTDHYIRTRLAARIEVLRCLRRKCFHKQDGQQPKIAKYAPHLREVLEDYYEKVKRHVTPSKEDDHIPTYQEEKHALDEIINFIDQNIHIHMAVRKRKQPKDTLALPGPADTTVSSRGRSPTKTTPQRHRAAAPERQPSTPLPTGYADMTGLEHLAKGHSKPFQRKHKTKTSPTKTTSPKVTSNTSMPTQPTSPTIGTPPDIHRRVKLPIHPTDGNPKVYAKPYSISWVNKPPPKIKWSQLLRSSQHREGTATLVDKDGHDVLVYCPGNGLLQLFTNMDGELFTEDELRIVSETAKDSIKKYLKGVVSEVIFFLKHYF